MKKKLSGLLLLLSVVCLAIGLFACKNTFIRDQIIFKNIIIDKDNFGYIKVSNGETLFNFSKEIIVKGKATYFISSDVDGVNRILEEVVSLKVGNNTFYVTQTVGEENTLYTLTIRRRPIYTVSFNSDGGTEVENQLVEEDSFASNPQEPTKAAYYFDGWDYDFTKPISGEVVVKARWIIDERLNQFDYTSTATTCEITGVKDKSVTSVEIPEYVTSIGKRAFEGCVDLKSLIIPDNVVSIGEGAFSRCSGLINVSLGNRVTYIGERAFYDCRALSNINIPDSVNYIGDYAFWICISLRYNEYDNAYYLGNSNNPFLVLINVKKRDISSCIINSRTKIIQDGAFAYCTELTNINLPNDMISIGREAFIGCKKLDSVRIMSTKINFGISAFWGCSNLVNIIFNGKISEWEQIKKSDHWKNLVPEDCVVHCADGDINI